MHDIVTYDNERKFLFHNWTSNDFTGMWGGTETVIKVGETKEFPMYLAYHFTKHLVDREMGRDGKEGSMSSIEAREPYETKTISEITAGTDSLALSSIKEKIREEIEAEINPGKKTKKSAKKEEVKESKKEFEDLN